MAPGMRCRTGSIPAAFPAKRAKTLSPHPAAVSVIPGASTPDRIKEDYNALKAKIPDDFWHGPRKEDLVAPNAPLPIDR